MTTGTLTFNIENPDIGLTGEGQYDISQVFKSLFIDNPTFKEEISNKIADVIKSIKKSEIVADWTTKLKDAFIVDEANINLKKIVEDKIKNILTDEKDKPKDNKQTLDKPQIISKTIIESFKKFDSKMSIFLKDLEKIQTQNTTEDTVFKKKNEVIISDFTDEALRKLDKKFNFSKMRDLETEKPLNINVDTATLTEKVVKWLLKTGLYTIGGLITGIIAGAIGLIANRKDLLKILGVEQFSDNDKWKSIRLTITRLFLNMFSKLPDIFEKGMFNLIKGVEKTIVGNVEVEKTILTKFGTFSKWLINIPAMMFNPLVMLYEKIAGKEGKTVGRIIIESIGKVQQTTGTFIKKGMEKITSQINKIIGKPIELIGEGFVFVSKTLEKFVGASETIVKVGTKLKDVGILLQKGGSFFKLFVGPLIRKLPFIGMFLSFASAISRFEKGDYHGGLIDMASMLAQFPLFGPIGTAISIALDLYNAKEDRAVGGAGYRKNIPFNKLWPAFLKELRNKPFFGSIIKLSEAIGLLSTNITDKKAWKLLRNAIDPFNIMFGLSVFDEEDLNDNGQFTGKSKKGLSNIIRDFFIQKIKKLPKTMQWIVQSAWGINLDAEEPQEPQESQSQPLTPENPSENSKEPDWKQLRKKREQEQYKWAFEKALPFSTPISQEYVKKIVDNNNEKNILAPKESTEYIKNKETIKVQDAVIDFGKFNIKPDTQDTVMPTDTGAILSKSGGVLEKQFKELIAEVKTMKNTLTEVIITMNRNVNENLTNLCTTADKQLQTLPLLAPKPDVQVNKAPSGTSRDGIFEYRKKVYEYGRI